MAATETTPVGEEIRREARVVGLRGLQIPSLEAVERRRLQLWIITTILLVSVAVGAAFMSLWQTTPVRSIVTPQVLRIAVILLSLAFCFYAIEKELHLRRLSRLLVDERVLTVALQNRLHEVSLLLDAGKAMNSVLELPAVLETILRSATELLGGRSGSIMMVDEDELVTACAHGNDSARGRRVRVGEGIAGHVARTREPLLITGDADPERFPGIEHREQAVTSAMSVPFESRGELLGVLNVNADPNREFSEYDLRAISLFAEQAASAIANARLFEAERSHVEELLELDKLKDDFIALVSHELRTPITTILAAAETAQRPGIGETRLELDRMIERQARRLSGMVEELLAAARMDQGPALATLDPVDLSAIVRTAAADADLAGNRVSVDVPATLIVLGDADGLRRVVDNLIDNAFKYGIPPVRITIERRGDRICLSVLDTGPGIPPEDRERVFERFQRLTSVGMRPGLGLGLSIVRGLVEACGGTVLIEDGPGGGAAMRVLLDEVKVREPV